MEGAPGEGIYLGLVRAAKGKQIGDESRGVVEAVAVNARGFCTSELI